MHLLKRWKWHAVIGILLVTLIFCLSLINPSEQSLLFGPTQDWGVGYPVPGQPSVGNKDSAYLKQFNAFYLGDVQKKRIYLTFDAGYENGNTPAILDALSRHKAKAAFFLVSHYLTSAPDLVRRMVKDGHLVCNHTATHPNMATLSDLTAFQKQLTDNEAVFTRITGKTMPKIYRPPSGKFNEKNLRDAQFLGYATVFWSLAYVDWQENNQPSPKSAMDKLTKRMHNGAIVLLHSTSSTNAKILDELLTQWEKQGYTFGSLTELTQ